MSTAVLFGSAEATTSLLTAGADPDELDSEGARPLMTAIHSGNMQTVQTLLAAGADPNLGEPAPISSFAAMSYPDVLRVLIEAGANINGKNAQGITHLNFAIGLAKTKAAAILLEFGADPNLANSSSAGGYVPLSTAMSGRFAHSGDQNPETTQNKQSSIEITKLLLEAGADPNIRQLQGETPLAYAVTNQDTQRVDQLMIAGGDPYIANCDGQTPLDIAARIGNAAIQTRLAL